MSISKRTRYEVMRRDNFTCRYCRSTEGQLTIDHVVPVALGGKDAPDNLVAACRDCNAGKSSSSPDASLVEDVNEDALRWSRAQGIVLDQRSQDRFDRDIYADSILQSWEEAGGSSDALPEDYLPTLWRFHKMGLPLRDAQDAVEITLTNRMVSESAAWRYFAGVCWRVMDEIREATLRQVRHGQEEGDSNDGS